MDREAVKQLAISLCEQHHCSEKAAKVHFDQMVKHGWNPHPPDAFVQWWKTHPENSIGAIRAFNCSCYVEQFKVAT